MALEMWYRSDMIRILNAVAHAGRLQGPEYHEAIRDIGRAFGVEHELDLPKNVSPMTIYKVEE